MLASPINNFLYECKNWRYAKANVHRIEPDVPESDASEPDAPEVETCESAAPNLGTPKVNSWYYVTPGAGYIKQWEPEWNHVLWYFSALNIVIMYESSSIWGDHMV